MKKIDSIGLMLCSMQGELFVFSKKQEYSSAVFIRRFMNSESATRFDNLSYFNSSDTNESVIKSINGEYGYNKYGREKFSDEELYWMGYIYRYWCYTRNEPSANVYKIIGANELRMLYYPYHSLDPNQAIERILEARGIIEEDEITKGVKIMRRLMKKD